jgi:tRNA 2-thiouridine synthesizing protein A
MTATVDARGLRCPWPVLRLARAMRTATSVSIIADDPAAPREIAALAQAQGWEISSQDGLIFVSRPGADKN